MRTTGVYQGALYDREGNILIQFAIDDPEEVQKLEDNKGKKLVIDAQIFRQARSNRANRYLWELLDLMAKKIGSDKDMLYHLALARYGVFVDMEVLEEAIPILERHFRVVERFNDGYEVLEPIEDGYTQERIIRVRCYYGSSTYNTKEMSDLIQGVVEDAKDIGVDTATPDEIASMLAAWKGGSE